MAHVKYTLWLLFKSTLYAGMQFEKGGFYLRQFVYTGSLYTRLCNILLLLFNANVWADVCNSQLLFLSRSPLDVVVAISWFGLVLVVKKRTRGTVQQRTQDFFLASLLFIVPFAVCGGIMSFVSY